MTLKLVSKYTITSTPVKGNSIYSEKQGKTGNLYNITPADRTLKLQNNDIKIWSCGKGCRIEPTGITHSYLVQQLWMVHTRNSLGN